MWLYYLLLNVRPFLNPLFSKHGHRHECLPAMRLTWKDLFNNADGICFFCRERRQSWQKWSESVCMLLWAYSFYFFPGFHRSFQWTYGKETPVNQFSLKEYLWGLCFRRFTVSICSGRAEYCDLLYPAYTESLGRWSDNVIDIIQFKCMCDFPSSAREHTQSRHSDLLQWRPLLSTLHELLIFTDFLS